MQRCPVILHKRKIIDPEMVDLMRKEGLLSDIISNIDIQPLLNR